MTIVTRESVTSVRPAAQYDCPKDNGEVSKSCSWRLVRPYLKERR